MLVCDKNYDEEAPVLTGLVQIVEGFGLVMGVVRGEKRKIDNGDWSFDFSSGSFRFGVVDVIGWDRREIT